VTGSSDNKNPLAEDLAHILSHTQRLWEQMRGRKIFVTGGTGFFGRWLLESFAHANDALGLEAEMVVLSRNPTGFTSKAPLLANHPAIAFVSGDVRSITVREVAEQLGVSGLAFDFVIHAATEANAQLNANNPLLMLDTIVDGTRSALRLARGTGAKRFLLTSSGAVYGTQPSELTHIPEDFAGGPDCTRPESAYAEGKRIAELLCATFALQHGVECMIARCFAFVGPFLPLDAHFAIGNFIRDAAAGGPIRIGGDGTPFRSYLYAADLAIWLWTILFKGSSLRPYNVGSARDLQIVDLAEAVSGAFSKPIPVVIAARQKSETPSSRYVPDTVRARAELGLNEYIELSEAIKRTAKHAFGR
jgi:dTDP-glucose 4,6-dehydratase